MNFRIENLRVVGNEEAEEAALQAAEGNGEAENGAGGVGEKVKGARWPHLVSMRDDVLGRGDSRD